MRCERADCQGEIVDGYCNECGMKPARSEPGPPESEANEAGSLTMPAAALGSRATTAIGTGSTSGTGSRRSRLGADLVEIPAVPVMDPSEAVMRDPTVPETRRFCAHCGQQVGQRRDGQAGRTEGFCPHCGRAFSFEPKLRPGELVTGQYEIAGCLAHGGMGWVYLARDRNVSDRWVVLKGLLNTGDPDATAAALAERQFLAEVNHPNIVKIYNFVEHGGEGYIVMEYVGGRSLKQIRLDRPAAADGRPEPLPAAEAIAYIYEILPALGHLHDQRLLFCDFKIDNVMQTQQSLTLIDLGGVYRMDEQARPMFRTVGYSAPELETTGPTVATDLYTVARTLAVLCIDFRGYQSKYQYELPAPDSVALFQRYDSLYRWLLRGTARNPRDRFESAEAMRVQLYGVLREVVADIEDRPVPAASTLFTFPLRAGTERPDWRALPRPQVARDDPSAGYLAALTASDPHAVIAQLRAAPEHTVEVDLRIAAALIDTGETEAAQDLLDTLREKAPRDWRVRWYRGVAELAAARPEAARELFRAVYDELPGEAAPKLGMGLTYEMMGETAEAARWYRTVAQTDPSVTSASFGLARCRLLAGDRAGAIAAYRRVPETSSGHLDAQVAGLRTALEGKVSVDDLLAAGTTLASLPVDDEQRERLNVELLGAALQLIREAPDRLSHGPEAGNGGSRLLGRQLEERDVRLGLERSLRSLARRAPNRTERIRLVDEANRMRPRTWT
jgi:serine/threonine-protein kinase PknG